jgi:hypothetical protein
MEGTAMNKKVLIEVLSIVVLSLLTMAEGFRLIIFKDPYILYDPLGPGSYILVLSFGLLAVGIVYFITNYRKPPSAGRLAESEKVKIQLFSSIGVLALYILLLHFVGYLLSTPIFFFLQLRISGVKSYIKTIVLSLVLSCAYYAVFVKLCGVAFPKGVFSG